MVVDRVDSESGDCKQNKEDNDDDRDGDVALHHFGWKRSGQIVVWRCVDVG